MDMICCCGHDCSKCRVYRATITNDDAMRDESVRFYKAQFNMDIPSEKMRCLGGRSEEIMEACLECPFKKCCEEKGLYTCSQCPQPCETFTGYAEKYINKYNQISE